VAYAARSVNEHALAAAAWGTAKHISTLINQGTDPVGASTSAVQGWWLLTDPQAVTKQHEVWQETGS